MRIMTMINQMEAVSASGVLLKPEDKAFLHKLEIDMEGTDTIMITEDTYDKVAAIHAGVFNLCKDEGCPQSSIDHVCVNNK